mmetsp:Transcript_72847/g.167245  ORF Transcript_72847/g.167245 Transcript_72847/m.167245 type:complete len:237 (+) Transcript_72847:265-975(+)
MEDVVGSLQEVTWHPPHLAPPGSQAPQAVSPLPPEVVVGEPNAVLVLPTKGLPKRPSTVVPLLPSDGLGLPGDLVGRRGSGDAADGGRPGTLGMARLPSTASVWRRPRGGWSLWCDRPRRSSARRLSPSWTKTIMPCSCTVLYWWARQPLWLPSVLKLSRSLRKRRVWDSTTTVSPCSVPGRFLKRTWTLRQVENRAVGLPTGGLCLLRVKRLLARSGAGFELKLVTTVFRVPFRT